MYPPRPTRLTSPEGLGMSGKEDVIGVRGDGGGDADDPLVISFSEIGNTCIMAWGKGETSSGPNRHRIDPGGK